MKSFRCFILFFILSTSIYGDDEDYSIVFVHIGEKIPAYAETAMFQARIFNQNCSIILLANEKALSRFSLSNPQLDITLITCESLPKTTFHKKFLKATTLDGRSREGFWLYTSERFLYLCDLMNQYNLKNVFHLEYDNMLYVDLSEILPIFQNQYKGIAATFDNDDRCIPGFVYISNNESMNQLAKYFADHASKKLNDMQLLALFKNNTNEKNIDHLPVITQEYVEVHPLISQMGHKVKNKMKYSNHIDLFHSIFDAAAIGQFLGGIDPNNGLSSPGFINERCIFNPSFLSIEWREDENKRRCPYIIYPDTKYKINNLHIHSKKLENFLSVK